MPAPPLPAMTTRQAKRAHKKNPIKFRFTASQLRRADRLDELEERRAKAEDKQQQKKANKRKRDEQDAKERDVQRKLLKDGKISIQDTWGKVSASQPRLNMFFVKPKERASPKDMKASKATSLLQMTSIAEDDKENSEPPTDDEDAKSVAEDEPVEVRYDSEEDTLVDKGALSKLDMGDGLSDADLLEIIPLPLDGTCPQSPSKTTESVALGTEAQSSHANSSQHLSRLTTDQDRSQQSSEPTKKKKRKLPESFSKRRTSSQPSQKARLSGATDSISPEKTTNKRRKFPNSIDLHRSQQISSEKHLHAPTTLPVEDERSKHKPTSLHSSQSQSVSRIKANDDDDADDEIIKPPSSAPLQAVPDPEAQPPTPDTDPFTFTDDDIPDEVFAALRSPVTEPPGLNTALLVDKSASFSSINLDDNDLLAVADEFELQCASGESREADSESLIITRDTITDTHTDATMQVPPSGQMFVRPTIPASASRVRTAESDVRSLYHQQYPQQQEQQSQWQLPFSTQDALEWAFENLEQRSSCL